MEQPVWMYIGVIGVLIVLGIIVQLTLMSSEFKEEQTIENSIVRMREQCNFVCSLDEGTELPIDVELFSGLKYYAEGKAICYSDENGENFNCERCNCELENYQLDLTTEEAREAFKSQEYNCYFGKSQGKVIMRCSGK